MSSTISDRRSIVVEEFFELGHEESSSPFITSSSRFLAANLTLKSSLLAAFLLLFSFVFSFYSLLLPISHLMLVGVYILAGIPALIESIEDLWQFEINIDVLMTFAAFSSVLIGSGMEGGLLLVLFALSGSMEDYVTARAKNSIMHLNKLSPTRACVIEKDGTLLDKAVRDVPLGAKILVRANQIIPLDGIVIDGASSVNFAHLTGENLPLVKKIGDEVASGARNMEGVLTIEVNRTSTDSTMAQIIQLVTQAQEEKPNLQHWFDRLSQRYAMSIIGFAFVSAFLMPFILNIPFLGREGSVYRSLAFLIAASPCALIIALPIAYLSAIGACARKGILLKGGAILDVLAQSKILAFDKTGTLTTGELQFIAIESVAASTTEQLRTAMTLAYALEKNAIHPIAKAIVNYGEMMQLPHAKISQFESIPGYGLQAKAIIEHQNLDILIGQPDFILPKIGKNDASLIQKKIEARRAEGEIITLLQIGKAVYVLRFVDTIRSNIENLMEDLNDKQNVRTVMLTGDHEESARRIAKELKIQEYHAHMTPEDKLNYIADTAATEHIAMIGDGVNDAPALARATVGICMGKVGSTPAIDAADIILLNDNIELIGWLIEKAKRTQKIVKQNLIIASLAIVIASFPALAGYVPLWVAVILHEGGTVIVGLNGLRLIRI